MFNIIQTDPKCDEEAEKLYGKPHKLLHDIKKHKQLDDNKRFKYDTRKYKKAVLFDLTLVNESCEKLINLWDLDNMTIINILFKIF